MTKLVLIRHGETDWNMESRWQGQADIPLNLIGLKQAESLAKSLAGSGCLTAIYSSDLIRARQTAEAIARRTGLKVHLEPRLREIHQGQWEGMLIKDIQARYSTIYKQRIEDPWQVSPPGGESTEHVRARVLSAVQDIVKENFEGKICVVSHGFALAVVIAHFQSHPINQIWDLIPENCKPVEIEIASR